MARGTRTPPLLVSDELAKGQGRVGSKVLGTRGHLDAENAGICSMSHAIHQTMDVISFGPSML